MNEASLLKAILKYLNSIGVVAWRNNTGAYMGEYHGRKRFVRFSTPGAADIFGIIPGGKFLAVEVKARHKRPTPLQSSWLKMISNQGAITIWVDSWDSWTQFCKRMDWPC